jgi:hypothetical protein
MRKIDLNVILTTDLKDGHYLVYLNEFDFGLPVEAQEQLIEKGEFEPRLFASGQSLQDLRVLVRKGRIDKKSFMECVDDLLNQCGWFNVYKHARVSVLEITNIDEKQCLRIEIDE